MSKTEVSRLLSWIFWLGVTSAAAQSTVTTSSPTSSGTVPVFNGTSTVTNSPITVSSGNVGVGDSATPPPTALDISPSLTNPSVNIPGAPGTPLVATGVLNMAPNLTFSDNANRFVYSAQFMPSILNSSTSGSLSIFALRSAAYRTKSTDLSTINILTGGSFNAGHADSTSTAMPTTTAVYGVEGSAFNYSGTISNSYGVWAQSYNTSANATTTNAYGVFSQIKSATSTVGTGYGLYTTTNISGTGTIGTYYGLYLADPSTSGITTRYGIYQANNLNQNFFAGNVGIGTPNPGAKLEINGNLRFTGDAAGVYQTTAWTGVLCGGDYAEAMNALGGKRLYEPGDVLVLTSSTENDVQKSSEPYSTMVAGIYATKPGVIGRRQTLVKDSEDLPMAMVGVVPTKVTAENGAIRKGDLLVSSSAPGYAMKGTDRTRMLGAVIGKAMGSLESGTGMIEVLVTLQ